MVAIGHNMTTDNVLSTYLAACQDVGDNCKIKDKCYQFIAKHYKAVTHHDDFVHLNQEEMLELVRNVTALIKV